jgi:hypothetical protein
MIENILKNRDSQDSSATLLFIPFALATICSFKFHCVDTSLLKISSDHNVRPNCGSNETLYSDFRSFFLPTSTFNPNSVL